MRRAHVSAGHPQAFESLWAGYLMHLLAVDIQQAISVCLLIYHMSLPNFVVKRGPGHN